MTDYLWEQPDDDPPDDTVVLSLFVPGNPKPQGSKNYYGHRDGRAILVEASAESRPWRDRVAYAAHDAYRPRPVLAEVALAARLEFVMPRPARTPRTTPPAIRRPDLDKLVRTVFDALTGPVFTDDSAIVTLHAIKRLAAPGEPPGVHITLRRRTP